MNFLIKAVFQSFQRKFHIIMRLEIKPELRFHGKEAPQAKCCVSGNCAPSMHDFIYASGRHANIFGQSVLRYTHRLQKFCQQDFAWMDRGEITFRHTVTSQW